MKGMLVTKRPFTEDGVIDQELSQGEDTTETAVHPSIEEVTVKVEKEGIKMAVDLEKEDSEEMEIIRTEDKVDLEVAKVKEDSKGLEGDEEMEVVEGMEMVKNSGNKSIHLIKME